MTVYVLNLLVGYVSTGVDYSQGYRARLFDQLEGVTAKHIYFELPKPQTQDYYESIGIRHENQLSMHLYLAKNTATRPSVLLEDKVKELETILVGYSKDVYEDKVVFRREYETIEVLRYLDTKYVTSVVTFNQNYLIKQEIYGQSKLYCDYFAPVDSPSGVFADLYKREFYDEAGQLVYEQLLNYTGWHYRFTDGNLYDHDELIALFFQQLQFSARDSILLDRTVNVSFYSQLLQYKNDARLLVFVHSEHFHDELIDVNYGVGINHEFYNVLKDSNQFDWFIFSTHSQKQHFEQLVKEEYGNYRSQFCVIPAGYLKDIRESVGRKKHSLLTVSRLTDRKRIHWIIQAVVQAKKEIPDLTLDIYGAPSLWEYGAYLEQLIRDAQAESYIRLMGHVENIASYPHYEAYISASVGETFGLSIMEALGSGTALLGYNVKYGNQDFIVEGRNGYLLDHQHDKGDGYNIDSLAQGIVRLFGQQNLDDFHKYSYQKAEDYLESTVLKAWEKMI